MNTTSNLLHMKFEPMTVMISFTIAPSSLYIFEILNFSTKVNLVESITSHCGDIWKFRIWCIKAMVSHNTSSCIVLLFTLFFFFFRRGVMVNCAFSPYIFNILLLIFSPSAEEENNALGYRLPPLEIQEIVDAPPTPALSFSPRRDRILFLKRRSLPTLSDLAISELKLGGLRIDADTNTRSRM